MDYCSLPSECYEAAQARAAEFGGRYNIAEPFDIAREAEIARAAASFFSLRNEEHYLRELNRSTTSRRRLTGSDLIDWLEKHAGDEPRRAFFQIKAILDRMEREGLLVSLGPESQFNFGMDRPLLFVKVMTARERSSNVWLGTVLGPKFTAVYVTAAFAHITGVTTNGDEAGGSGILLHSEYVVTCAHVLTDMQPRQVTIAGEVFDVAEVKVPKGDEAHRKSDVGLVRLSRPTKPIPGIALDDAALLQQHVVLGAAPVPLSTHPVYTAQMAEVNGGFTATNGRNYLLLSSIVRPGDSGGPIATLDGRIIGIVCASVEREAATKTGLPFFAAVGAADIVEAVRELDPSITLPFEDYK
jgi:hypothetical protein